MTCTKRTTRSRLAVRIAFGVSMLCLGNPTVAAAQVTFSSIVKSALATDMKIGEFVTAEAALVTSSTVQAVGCDIANFAIGRALPAGVPGPFNAACGSVQLGAGSYMFGNTGPGGVMPFNRFTAYVPTKVAGCTTREYNFTFSINGPNTFSTYANKASALFDKGGALDAYSAKMGAPLAVTAWKALYDAIGDFAIVVAINPGEAAAYIYVLASDMPKLEAQISKDVAAAGSSVQAAMAAANGSKPYLDAVANAALQLKGAMAGSTEGIAINKTTILRGSVIQDHFAGACYSPLLFYYMAGTGNVLFN